MINCRRSTWIWLRYDQEGKVEKEGEKRNYMRTMKKIINAIDFDMFDEMVRISFLLDF